MRQNKGEDVQSYANRFWNCLILLQAIEHVDEKKLKRNFLSGLLPSLGADLNMSHPHSLSDIVSLALNSETKHGKFGSIPNSQAFSHGKSAGYFPSVLIG